MQLTDALLRGAGLAGQDARMAWRAVALALCAYAAGFALWYPRIATNDDEAKYLRQAQLMAEGRTTIEKLDAQTGETIVLEPSQYPPGTAALMAPFVRAFGWRGAYLLPFLTLVGAVLVTARWIAEQGRSPAFALVLLSFPATLVLGRVTMSDVPSLLVASLGLWLFWRGIEGRPAWWFTSGLCAGASMMLRETVVLVFVPLFAGTLLRRERKCWALLVGGLLGVAARLVASHWTFGDAFYVKAPFVLEPSTFMDRLPIYLLGLLVFVPGGLAFGLAYRGPRSAEIRISIAICFLFYLIQPYSMLESGFAKRLVIALRYFVPLLPILAFAMSESVPRLWRRLAGGATPPVWERAAAAAAGLYLAGTVSVAFLVHPVYQRWCATQAAISDAIHEVTGADSVLVTNWWSTKKFTRELERTYLPIDRDAIDARGVKDLVRRHQRVFVAFLDRSDSEHWRRDAQRNDDFVERLGLPHALAYDEQISPTDRLRIWRVGGGSPRTDEAGP